MPRRVLVVDDNVDAATTLNLLLKSLGHETCVVYDGVQALKMAVDFRPDIVLLDIGMPGLDGYEVARRLRALRRTLRCESLQLQVGVKKRIDKSRKRQALMYIS